MLLVLSAVVALAADSPPRIVRGLPSALRVEAKAAVFLECEAIRARTMSWLVDGRVLVESSRVLTFESENGSTLVLKSVLAADAGSYLCNASNEHGWAASKTNVVLSACGPGSFSKSDGICEACPAEGVNCDAGIARPVAGYYLGKYAQLMHTSVLDRCPFKDSCLASEDMNHTICAAQYTGIVCSECGEGYGRSNYGCVKCMGWGKMFFVIFSGTIILGSVVGWAVYGALLAEKNGGSKRIVAPFKIMVSYYITLSIMSRYQADWGYAMRMLFQVGGTTAAGDVSSLSFRSCFGVSYLRWAWVTFFLPVYCILIPAVLVASWWGYRRWWCNEQKPTCLGVHGRMEDRSGL